MHMLQLNKTAEVAARSQYGHNEDDEVNGVEWIEYEIFK